MNVKVKICGVRSIKSAVHAALSGADFIGLNFVGSSKRFITVAEAKTITEAVEGRVKTVGVFQNADINHINDLVRELDLDYVQLHGEESTKSLKKIHTHVIKAIAVSEKQNAEDILDEIAKYHTDYFLLDRKEQGNGENVNLEVAHKISRKHNIFLAGGLNPENITHAVQKVKPYAVDVAGGIETNGLEDLEKISLFIKRAKGAIL